MNTIPTHLGEHCYFIISPDPSEGLELKIVGEAYGHTDDSKAEPGKKEKLQSRQLHFVEFGDEEKIKNRVKEYRTHQPTCKLYHTSTVVDPGFDVSDTLVANKRAQKPKWSGW